MASFGDVVVEAGDVVLVNNRTAIHGRAEVAMTETEESKRWLLRTYGQFREPMSHCASKKAKHVLCMMNPDEEAA